MGAVTGMVTAAALQETARTPSASAGEAALQSAEVAAAAGQAAANVRRAAAEQRGASVQEIAGPVAGSSRLAQTAVGEADRAGGLMQDLASATELTRQSDRLGQEVARFLETVRAA